MLNKIKYNDTEQAKQKSMRIVRQRKFLTSYNKQCVLTYFNRETRNNHFAELNMDWNLVKNPTIETLQRYDERHMKLFSICHIEREQRKQNRIQSFELW